MELLCKTHSGHGHNERFELSEWVKWMSRRDRDIGASPDIFVFLHLPLSLSLAWHCNIIIITEIFRVDTSAYFGGNNNYRKLSVHRWLSLPKKETEILQQIHTLFSVLAKFSFKLCIISESSWDHLCPSHAFTKYSIRRLILEKRIFISKCKRIWHAFKGQ